MHGHSDQVGDVFLRLFSLRIVFAWRVLPSPGCSGKSNNFSIFSVCSFVRLVRLALQVRAMEGREGGGEQSK